MGTKLGFIEPGQNRKLLHSWEGQKAVVSFNDVTKIYFYWNIPKTDTSTLGKAIMPDTYGHVTKILRIFKGIKESRKIKKRDQEFRKGPKYFLFAIS